MTFGIMFHHFHSDSDAQFAPGSMTAKTFDRLLTAVKQDYKILEARDYTRKAQAGTLSKTDICITFDDALRPQADIAREVLDAHSIKAFFFVYTGAFRDPAPLMEFARDFRSSFATTDDYYDQFWTHLQSRGQNLDRILAERFPDDYLSAFPFYSLRDRQYRFIRDHVLAGNYEPLVRDLMSAAGYDWTARQAAIFMPEADLASLANDGHIIGLHSVTHPTMMQNLSVQDQADEYAENFEHLSTLAAEPIITMSHPCGNYGPETLSILQKMGMKVGFRSSMTPNTINSLLEIPRDDHSNLVKHYGL